MRTRRPVSIEDKLTDASLQISASDVEFCQKMVSDYEAKAVDFQAKAEAAPPRKRGAYKSHRAQTLKARDRMKANMEFQLEWLRRHRPNIYEEVK